MFTHYARRPLGKFVQLGTPLETLLYTLVPAGKLVTADDLQAAVRDRLSAHPGDRQECLAGTPFERMRVVVESTLRRLCEVGALAELHGMRLEKVIAGGY